MRDLKFDKRIIDFTVLALVGIMVLNFENDLPKSAHHVSYDIYQRIFFFAHHRYHNHFVRRVDWIYHFCRLEEKQNRIPYEYFVLNVFPVIFAGAYLTIF